MNKFYDVTMGPLPQKYCHIFSFLSYLELFNLLILAVIVLALFASGKVWLGVLSLFSIAVIFIRYLSTRLLFNMCRHAQ